MASSSYEPTPLEEAYASFLLDKVFAIQMNNDVIRIPGRKAVPFLTTSGVEREILRDAWGIADPDSVGKLKSKDQFCTVLRLVALAQAGCVTGETANLSQALIDHKEEIPLPTFESVEIPSTPFLMATYGSKFEPREEKPVLSVTDAFDQIVHVEDAPLPTLPVPPVETPAIIEDDFGSFEGPEQVDGTDDDGSGDDFDDFVEASEQVVEETEPAVGEANSNLSEAPGTNVLLETEQPVRGQSLSEESDLFRSARTELTIGSDKDESGDEEGDDFGDFAEAEEGEVGVAQGYAHDTNSVGHNDEEVFGDLEGESTLVQQGEERGEKTEGEETLPGVDDEPAEREVLDLNDRTVQEGDSNDVEKEEGQRTKETGVAPSVASDDDPFAAFDALAEPPAPAPQLPPLAYLSEQKVAQDPLELNLIDAPVFDGQGGEREIKGDEEADVMAPGMVMRDAPVLQNSGTAEGAQGVEGSDFDDFGDFETAGADSATHGFGEALEPVGAVEAKDDGIGTTVDDFGDFNRVDTSGEATDYSPPENFAVGVGTSAKAAEEKLPIDGGGESVGVDDGFGDFEGSEEPPPVDGVSRATDSAPDDESGDTDDSGFGDFEGVDSVVDTEPTKSPEDERDCSSAGEPDTRDNGDDGFGDFGEFEATSGLAETPEPFNTPSDLLSFPVAVSDETDKTTSAEDDASEPDRAGVGDSGEKDSPPDIGKGVDIMDPATKESSDDFGEFAGFESCEPARAPEVNKEESGDPDETVVPPENETTDDFGDFAAFESGTPGMTGTSRESGDFIDETANEESDDFGDFAAFGSGAPEAAQEENGGSGDFVDPTENETSDDFGDFATFESSTPGVASESPDMAKGQSGTPSFDADFGGFESAEFEEAKDVSLAEMREQLLAMSSKLPEPFCSRDVVRNFEFSDSSEGRLCLEEQSKIDPERVSQHLDLVRRCHKIHTLLTSTHTTLPSGWEQIMTISRDELATSIFLLEEAKELSPAERRHVSQSLQIMVSGLGEYLRVVHLVVATVADFLGLELQVTLAESNVHSRWHSISLAKLALEIESLWEDLCRASAALGLEDVNVDSVRDIRNARRVLSDPLCELTLQPISPKEVGTTRSKVVWDGRTFFACAANFWAHKVSTAAP